MVKIKKGENAGTRPRADKDDFFLAYIDQFHASNTTSVLHDSDGSHTGWILLNHNYLMAYIVLYLM